MKLGAGFKLLEDDTELFVTYYGQVIPVSSIFYEMGTNRLIIAFDSTYKALSEEVDEVAPSH